MTVLTYNNITSNIFQTNKSICLWPKMSMICRACLQTVDKNQFFYIDTFDNSQIPNTIPKDVLQLCVPEMDLYISEHPGVCTECLAMFETFYNFKNRCLASEDKILSYLKKNKVNPQCKINLSCVLYDAGEHLLFRPEEPDNNKALAQLELNGEVELLSLRNATQKADVSKPEEKEVLLLSCNECSFMTMEREKLVNHKCLAIAASERYKCPYCEYCTGRRYRLSYHINAKHTKANWYECTQCEYKTTDSSSLRRHQKVVHLAQPNNNNCHDNNMKFLSCKLCEFKTISEIELQRHKLANHGPAIQVCPICNYQTKDKSNFRKHTYIHGDKPRKCTKCSYQCVSPYQLERHYKRSHI